MKKAEIILLLVGIILIVFPVLLFITRFWHFGLSNNPKDWIDFGAFYFGMLGLIITGYIAVVVHKLNLKNARIGLQFEAYKEIVNILTSLTNDIKPMKKTNKEIDDKICETFISLHHFEENYTFLFDRFKKVKFNKYEQQLTKILNEFRKLQPDLIFGIDGIHGAEVINKTNLLIYEIQKSIK